MGYDGGTGRLEQETARHWRDAGYDGAVDTYDQNGRISQVTTAEGQDYNIVYSPYGVLTIYDASWSNIRAASSHDVAYTYPGRRFDPETEWY